MNQTAHPATTEDDTLLPLFSTVKDRWSADAWEMARLTEALEIKAAEERGFAIGYARGLAIGEERGFAIGYARGLEKAVARLIATGMDETEARQALGLA